MNTVPAAPPADRGSALTEYGFSADKCKEIRPPEAPPSF